jgi:hypothetical protein
MSAWLARGHISARGLPSCIASLVRAGVCSTVHVTLMPFCAACFQTGNTISCLPLHWRPWQFVWRFLRVVSRQCRPCMRPQARGLVAAGCTLPGAVGGPVGLLLSYAQLASQHTATCVLRPALVRPDQLDRLQGFLSFQCPMSSWVLCWPPSCACQHVLA